MIFFSHDLFTLPGHVQMKSMLDSYLNLKHLQFKIKYTFYHGNLKRSAENEKITDANAVYHLLL